MSVFIKKVILLLWHIAKVFLFKNTKQQPAGFFKTKENQKHFINELGRKLGFNGVSDWYKITTKDIRSYGGRALLAQYNDCSPAVVMGVMDDVTWFPWLFQTAKSGWTESSTARLRYMEYLSFIFIFSFSFSFLYFLYLFFFLLLLLFFSIVSFILSFHIFFLFFSLSFLYSIIL